VGFAEPEIAKARYTRRYRVRARALRATRSGPSYDQLYRNESLPLKADDAGTKAASCREPEWTEDR